MQLAGVNDLRVSSIRVFQPESDEILSPVTRHRNNAFLITQQNIESNLSEIERHHSQLSSYIDSLEQKVARRLESNEAEIMEAYRNHMTLVRKDMVELRRETQAQANSSNSFEDQVDYLEKKLVVFREEALRLFGKLEMKDKEVEEMRRRTQQMATEKKYMDESIKLLTKRSKQLEAQLSQLRNRPKNEAEDFSLKFDTTHLNTTGVRSKQYRHRNRTTLTSAHLSKAVSSHTNAPLPKQLISYIDNNEFLTSTPKTDLFGKKLRLKLDYLEGELRREVVRVAEETFGEVFRHSSSKMEGPTSRLEFQRGRNPPDRTTRVSMRSRSNRTVGHSDQPGRGSALGMQGERQEASRQSLRFSIRQQMSGYFVKCVQTIKKEITRRKQMSSLNFFKEGNPISHEQFKKLDCYRLMELALSSEKVVEGLYNLLLATQE